MPFASRRFQRARSPTVEHSAPAAGPATDFEILLSEDSLDMLEDLEFYSWMDTANLDSGSDVG